MKERRLGTIVAVVFGTVLGLVTGAAGLAVAQGGPELSAEAALAAREAQLIAREAELDEREERLANQEASAPIGPEDCAALLDDFTGPPLPEGWAPSAAKSAEASTETENEAGQDVVQNESDGAAPSPPEATTETSGPSATEIARTLKAMKPKKAGLVVVELDRDLVASAMSTLSARSRAKILENVPPGVAAEVASKLQGDR